MSQYETQNCLLKILTEQIVVRFKIKEVKRAGIFATRLRMFNIFFNYY